MRTPGLAALAAAAVLVTAPLVLAACASSRGASVDSSVFLAPGGHAEGRILCPADVQTVIKLKNRGPGRAIYVIKTAEGEQVAIGALGEATSTFRPASATSIVVVLETYADAEARIEYQIECDGKLNMDWDLSRASPPGTAK
jgi:hypothetical protein